MSARNLLTRIAWKYRRTVSDFFCRKMVAVKLTTPIISFSFDDAPRTAFTHGGGILKAHGARATFFVSLGMLESGSPSGIIASQNDLRRAVEEGHELGCHTFDHKDPWKTKTEVFEQSVLKNRQALARLIPNIVFSTFAYPLCGPKPVTKSRIGKLFNCCRGGGQTFNVGKTDFNLLKAFFLDIRNGDTIDTVRHLINRNSESRGWLIFATHDVDDNPSPYGCTKEYFEKVVQYAVTSGALLLPIGNVCEQIKNKSNNQKCY
jgi:peptidoglycan/xylan/chitin deacetylase (PgdA/CDA1 family)